MWDYREVACAVGAVDAGAEPGEAAYGRLGWVAVAVVGADADEGGSGSGRGEEGRGLAAGTVVWQVR
ncbi:hypothetical protein [Acrocarpospora macrocephala]|uniref:hypothetical protein n=1 Tax=Acrocarpospora macrocephala TaxID=150177 RepID=UPI0012D35A95|nr:hypothetical protein [Acrocarpospora macrocephala]